MTELDFLRSQLADLREVMEYDLDLPILKRVLAEEQRLLSQIETIEWAAQYN